LEEDENGGLFLLEGLVQEENEGSSFGFWRGNSEK